MLIIAALIGLFAAKSNAVEPAIAPKNSDIECQAKLEHRPNGGGGAAHYPRLPVVFDSYKAVERPSKFLDGSPRHWSESTQCRRELRPSGRPRGKSGSDFVVPHRFATQI